MRKLRMRVDDLRVESFDTSGAGNAARGTVRARMACSASEEGESLCCPTETDQASCYGTCEGTCQDSCGCTYWDCTVGWTCGYTCICPSHHGTACSIPGSCVAACQYESAYC